MPACAAMTSANRAAGVGLGGRRATAPAYARRTAPMSSAASAARDALRKLYTVSGRMATRTNAPAATMVAHHGRPAASCSASSASAAARATPTTVWYGAPVGSMNHSGYGASLAGSYLKLPYSDDSGRLRAMSSNTFPDGTAGGGGSPSVGSVGGIGGGGGGGGASGATAAAAAVTTLRGGADAAPLAARRHSSCSTPAMPPPPIGAIAAAATPPPCVAPDAAAAAAAAAEGRGVGGVRAARRRVATASCRDMVAGVCVWEMRWRCWTWIEEGGVEQ